MAKIRCMHCWDKNNFFKSKEELAIHAKAEHEIDFEIAIRWAQ